MVNSLSLSYSSPATLATLSPANLFPPLFVSLSVQSALASFAGCFSLRTLRVGVPIRPLLSLRGLTQSQDIKTVCILMISECASQAMSFLTFGF